MLQDQKLLEFRLQDITSRISSLEKIQQEYLQFCQQQNITPDITGVEISQSIKQMMLKILEEFRVDAPESSEIVDYSQYITRENFRIRNLLLLLRQFASHMEWSSASYTQAVTPNFFDLRKQTEQIVNYDRWESFMIADLEKQLRSLYKLDEFDDDEQWSLILTSSGMAAYATIHNYLIRHLSPHDNILIPIPVYHEAEALLSVIPDIQITRLGSTDADEIMASITPQTKVICLTPITNDEDMRFLDIESLIKKISLLKQDIWIVVDGTMTGGLIRPERFISSNNQEVKLLYFESGNKYQQFEDTAMKGIVIVPQSLSQELRSVRREIGSMLYDQLASCLPQSISSEEMELKMQRFARNALLLSDRINNSTQLKDFCGINYPFHPTHLDSQIATRYSLMQLGGVVTISFYDPLFYNKKRLDEFIQSLIDRAQEVGLPFCKGDSYGFSVPRMHIGGSKTDKPFLRLCVGNRSLNEIKAFTDCLLHCLNQCLTHTTD